MLSFKIAGRGVRVKPPCSRETSSSYTRKQRVFVELRGETQPMPLVVHAQRASIVPGYKAAQARLSSHHVYQQACTVTL